MYFKRNLCLRQIDISFFPDECILCQININNKKASIIVFFYRSPSQTSSQFNIFQYNLDKIPNDVKQLGSSYLIMLVDFNAKSKTWWTNDITTSEDFDIWFASANIKPNPYLAKLILMYRSDFHWPNKFRSRYWSSSIIAS